MIYYTHSGRFHCDETTGYVITKLARICTAAVRLTSLDNLPINGIIADIGREYDSEKNRFDHHQGLLLRSNGFPYASAGLLWAKYGEDVVKNILPKCRDVAEVAEMVDVELIQGIDAHDADDSYSAYANSSNGEVRIHTLPNIVSLFNTDDINDHEAQHNAFMIASSLIESVIKKIVKNCNAYLEDKKDFERIVEVENQVAVIPRPLKWQKIVGEPHYYYIVYVISPSSHPGNPYSMTAVSKNLNSREVKLPIERPEFFKGFIHQGKWIAGAETIQELKDLANYNLNRT